MIDRERELIELAAKALGYQVKGWVGEKLSYFNPILDHAGVGDWNPLLCDGDAMRLLMDLDLRFSPCEKITRRAIVEAAAKIRTDK